MRQNFLTIIILALLAAGGYVWYTSFRSTESPPAPSGAVGLVSEENARLQQYRQLKNLKPDKSIIADPLFQSLERFRPAVPPPPAAKGRPNPFLPF